MGILAKIFGAIKDLWLYIYNRELEKLEQRTDADAAIQRGASKNKSQLAMICVMVLAVTIGAFVAVGANLATFVGAGSGEIVTNVTSSGGAGFGEVVEQDYVALPSGCAVFCGNEPLPGYPTSLPKEDGCDATIRVENCPSVCLTLAAEVDVHQTWMGAFILYLLFFWTLNGIGRVKTFDTKQGLIAVTTFAGFINASIMSWRLLVRTSEAMSEDITCLWPNPYEAGGVLLVNRSRFFVWMISACSPAMATIIKGGLVQPIMWWYSILGERLADGHRVNTPLAIVLSLACFPVIITTPTVVVGATVAAMWGLALIGLIFLMLMGQWCAIKLGTKAQEAYHKKFTAVENYPLAMYIKTTFTTEQLEEYGKKGSENWLGLPLTFGVAGISGCILFQPYMQYGLYTFTLPLMSNGLSGMPRAIMNNAPLGAAYARFFDGVNVPTFVWLELFGQVDTIEGQLAIAILIELLLIVQNYLPNFGASFMAKLRDLHKGEGEREGQARI
jgi:hypothetical protein